MLIPDVNVLVYAFRRESPRHKEYKAWLEHKLVGIEPVGLSELALSGFVRIVTNHRIFTEPETPETALEFCEAVRQGPAAIPVRAGEQHWPIFVDLCRTSQARANLVPDAYHAALAIEHAATWMTTDRGFARFPGLAWSAPLEEPPA